MDIIQIPIDGKITNVERMSIPLADLELDKKNPRIQYYLDSRLNDDVSQDEIKLALAEGNEQYEKLKSNIEENGGIVNPIWVVPDGTRYRVIEGNTRVLVYMELSEKYVNDEKWQLITAYVLPIAVERYKINFIRLEAHLFGTTPWDAYEKARELHRLYTEEDYSVNRLKQLTKLSESDIRNSIQAFMDMDQDYFPEYGKPGEQLKFSYFVEFRKSKDLKRLLAKQQIGLSQFCDLVGKGRLRRGEDVRRLAEVWSDAQSRAVLLQEGMTAALDQLAQKNPAANSKLFLQIASVAAGLQNMPLHEFNDIKYGMQPAKAIALVQLHTALTQLLDNLEIPSADA